MLWRADSDQDFIPAASISDQWRLSDKIGQRFGGNFADSWIGKIFTKPLQLSLFRRWQKFFSVTDWKSKIEKSKFSAFESADTYANTILNLTNDENRTDRLFLDIHLTSIILNSNDIIISSEIMWCKNGTVYRYHIYYFMHRYSHDTVIIMTHYLWATIYEISGRHGTDLVTDNFGPHRTHFLQN